MREYHSRKVGRKMGPKMAKAKSAAVAPKKSKTGTELVIITGLSGSGKGTVLKALEDLGYY